MSALTAEMPRLVRSALTRNSWAMPLKPKFASVRLPFLSAMEPARMISVGRNRNAAA